MLSYLPAFSTDCSRRSRWRKSQEYKWQFFFFPDSFEDANSGASGFVGERGTTYLPSMPEETHPFPGKLRLVISKKLGKDSETMAFTRGNNTTYGLMATQD
ncbi:hypothetical protein PoB_002594800 [Plakobranchus ocellatus]|uniref:Uncharacterized protein n=1 Tax=Plakobranchus ocellatus TaxID=259542 RepID=A0AAV3ZYG5_9GAST|nr:hypothetical protein PoB_002594800 [Plakobranchus ocellatus]